MMSDIAETNPISALPDESVDYAIGVGALVCEPFPHIPALVKNALTNKRDGCGESCIWSAFAFDSTPQGADFWASAAEQQEADGTLPEEAEAYLRELIGEPND
jgi:hypothetical protein